MHAKLRAVPVRLRRPRSQGADESRCHVICTVRDAPAPCSVAAHAAVGVSRRGRGRRRPRPCRAPGGPLRCRQLVCLVSPPQRRARAATRVPSRPHGGYVWLPRFRAGTRRRRARRALRWSDRAQPLSSLCRWPSRRGRSSRCRHALMMTCTPRCSRTQRRQPQQRRHTRRTSRAARTALAPRWPPRRLLRLSPPTQTLR